MVGNPDPILRAKYLDWCSARIAERFLELSPDEIYQRAEQAHSGSLSETPPAALLPFDPATSQSTADWHAAVDQVAATVIDPMNPFDAGAFRALVARVTEVLADELQLPTFEEWSAAYSEAPEEFDRDMLGFWRDERA